MSPAGVPVLDAVVLAGGAARRLGGGDKAMVDVGGSTLLDRVLAAVGPLVAEIVLVGPGRTVVADGTLPRSRSVQEQPPGGGPVAAIAAGMASVTAPLVAVLAVDLPFVTTAALERLRDALLDHPIAEGALYIDPAGRDQLLFGVWRTDRLRAALPERPHGTSVRSVTRGLDVLRLTPADVASLLDCDTPEDVAAARRLATPLVITDGTDANQPEPARGRSA